MAVLRRTYVSVLMESGAVALGSNKHDLSSYMLEETEKVLPADTGSNQSEIKTSVTLTS